MAECILFRFSENGPPLFELLLPERRISVVTLKSYITLADVGKGTLRWEKHCWPHEKSIAEWPCCVPTLLQATALYLFTKK